jgi:signal transduction histidine kinase
MLWTYTGLTLLGVVLHFISRQPYGELVNWIYQGLTLAIGVTALISLYRLRSSLTRAMWTFTLGATLGVTGLFIHELETQGNYGAIIPMYHIGIFSLGLILGFRPAVFYATGVSSILLTIDVLYSFNGELALYVVLAYAMALPSKVVERLIEESTAELSRVNRRLREEIAERRRAELALQEHRDHLEDLVAARTAELQARTAELEARNEELDAFAHTVAHDLKSPVASIVGFSELVYKRYQDAIDDRTGETLEFIARLGRQVARIVDELLLLATVRRLDDVELTQLNMASILDDVQVRLSDLIAETEAEIVAPEHWPAAMGYPPWIEEVWANYISNAIKYGGQPPHVELGATAREQGRVCFWVRDNGKGLTTEEQQRLFTPFTRLEQVTAKGHGLGLSIVRRIIHKLDGEVKVKSEVGHGSTFMFTLQAADTHPSARGDRPRLAR